MNANISVSSDNLKRGLNDFSSHEQLLSYFESICHLVDEQNDEFPVNLDDVWPLVYGRKSDAVEALTKEYFQDVDYQVLRQNPQNPLGGRPTNEYHLSVSCLEHFIARKKREVFEVYRQVFHAARKGRFAQPPMTKSERTLATIRQLCELAEKDVELERKQLQLEREQRAIEQKISDIEEVIKPNGFMSVMGFANIHRINIGTKAAASIGRLASKWCKVNHRKPEKIRHERWGEVNAYPMDALRDCFAEFYPDYSF